MHFSFTFNSVSGEKGKQKVGPLSHLGYEQMKEPSSLTGTQKKKVVNEESERAHYDNMQHNIKPFALLLA